MMNFKIVIDFDVKEEIPFNRKGIKRNPKFMKIVEDIEDYMMKIN